MINCSVKILSVFGLRIRLSACRTFKTDFQSNFLSKSFPSKRKSPHFISIINTNIGISSVFQVPIRFISAIRMSPPGVVENFAYNLTPEELLEKAETLIADCRKLYDKVANVQDSDVSCETVLQVLNQAEILLRTKSSVLDFGQYVSPDSDIRKASTEADRKVTEFCTEMSMRKDIFEKLLILEKKGEPLSPQAKRYLEREIRTGKRNGLHLDENTQKRVKELKSKLNNLSIDFMKNYNEANETLEFSKEELNGLPDDFFEGLTKKPDTDMYEVTTKYPHYFPIMEKCKVPETRRRIDFAFQSQSMEENGPIITELRSLRHELAVLLGYPNNAAYRTEILMSKSPENVQKFLNDLAGKMTPFWIEEKKYLLEMKEKECAELGIPFDGKLNSWDLSHYIYRTKEVKYAVDKNKLREYFPFPVVKEGLLKIYQDLLGLKFELVQGDIWHEDVEMYSVADSSTGDLLGYFYLDLFPRPNKYGHAAFFPLQDSVRLPDGSRQLAVGAMVANFTKPLKDSPALLDHKEVETFFHEFGHGMHYVCADVEYVSFGPFQVETDFIEAPSQMLENWCWEKESLRKMSSHYLDQSEIPEDILNPLVKSRKSDAGHFNLRQVVLSSFDQRIHYSPKGNTRELLYEIYEKIIGITPPEGTDFSCRFTHLAGGYDAKYYSYLWSEVYSMDMYQTKFGAENVLNPDVGKEYRNKILMPGATQDAYDLVSNFLGREPNQEAFLRSKGVKV